MDCAAAVEGCWGWRSGGRWWGLGVVGTREGRQRGCGVWATGNLPLKVVLDSVFSTACTAENPRRAGKRHFSLSKLPVRQRTRGGARHRAGILSKLPVRQRTAIPGPPACLNISKLPVRQRTVPRSSSWPTIFSKLPVRQRTCSCSCSCSCSFSKLPVRQRTAWIVGWFSTHFSKLPVRQRTRRAHSLASGIFLSCLCGSERDHRQAVGSGLF